MGFKNWLIKKSGGYTEQDVSEYLEKAKRFTEKELEYKEAKIAALEEENRQLKEHPFIVKDSSYNMIDIPIKLVVPISLPQAQVPEYLSYNLRMFLGDLLKPELISDKPITEEDALALTENRKILRLKLELPQKYLNENWLKDHNVKMRVKDGR